MGADHRAHPGQQFALAVLLMFRDHGAVQIQVDRIDRQAVGKGRDQ